jgi:antitoxin YefM
VSRREAFRLSRGADTIPVMTTRTIPLSDREPRLSDLADRANEFLERFILTREGEARAVLLAAQDFDGLLETLDILSDSELVQRLVSAEAELAHGGGHFLDEVREEIRSGRRGSTFQPG